MRNLSYLAMEMADHWPQVLSDRSMHGTRLLDHEVWPAVPYCHSLREFHLRTNRPYIDTTVHHVIAASQHMVVLSYCYETIDGNKYRKTSDYGDLPRLCFYHLSVLKDLRHLMLQGMGTFPTGMGQSTPTLLQPSFRLRQLALVDCAMRDEEFAGLLAAQVER